MNTQIELPLPPLTDTTQTPVYHSVPVMILTMEGQQIEGRMTRFAPHEKSLNVINDGDGNSTEVLFRELKAVHLTEPLPWVPDRQIRNDSDSKLSLPEHTQSFTIQFRDKSVLKGETYGTKIDPNGLHLFKAHKTNQYIDQYIHIFIPNSAMQSNHIGKPLGEILISDHVIPRDEVTYALDEQLESRTKPIGEYLLHRQIVNPEQLQEALKRQRHMPQLMLGEILVSENVISQEQLDYALAEQTHNRGTPLGEILVKRKIVTTEQIQQALAKKLGIPFANIQEFDIAIASDPEE